MRRVGRIFAWILGVLAITYGVLWIVLHHAPTATTPGPEAEALARDMVHAVDGDAWARTGAVRWTVMSHRHLWDKARGLARVEWGRTRVLLVTGERRGRAWDGDAEVTDEAARGKLVDRAYKMWINDGFWLNPVVKAFDDGTSRSRGTVGGRRALEVAYASGGVTPGDRYLWILGDDARPVAWRLFVQILPIKGVEISWEGWTRLPTGAWIATSHRIGPFDVIHLTDVAAGATLSDVEPGDPFAPLFASAR